MSIGESFEFQARPGAFTARDASDIVRNKDVNAVCQSALLCNALPGSQKELARAYYRAMVPGDRGHFCRGIRASLAMMRSLGIERSVIECLDKVPSYSFALEFRFQLVKPYISRDDDAFYIIENPVHKEKVFKAPCIAPTSWKGGLRAAATDLLLEEMDGFLGKHAEMLKENTHELEALLWKVRAKGVLLFGNENEATADFINGSLAKRMISLVLDQDTGKPPVSLKEKRKELADSFTAFLKNAGYISGKIAGRQGRLYFFPTFFDRIGLEVINPHEPRRRVGTNPILFECVPAGATGRFSLLYMPFDFQSCPCQSGRVLTPDEPTLKEQLSGDLPLICAAIREMMVVRGFGAKTSSGYGTSHDELDGQGAFAAAGPLGGPVSGRGVFSSLSDLWENASAVVRSLKNGGPS